ncbi:peroxide stress protein YaaA [Nocardioides sp.]|uniref:peroxide stress protein YaaA n=1 Tax=Nocardioides sp. TaxID=35761 RepID=UPI0026249ED9|nr:peroxide stress protein YaaA [Nocardioides sp.]
MLILLPPSEGKASPTRGKPLDLSTLSVPVLNPAREAVIEALVELCESAPEKAMEALAIPKTQPELVGLNARLRSAPTAVASTIYTGVVYDALSFETLSSAAKRRANGRVMVASSVFGLVGLADRIPAYRLSGDATVPGLGGVQAHWRAHLEPAALEALGSGLLIDLRSGTYAAFWKPTAVAARTATVRVLHERDGVRKVVSHFNKATKGRIVRALLEEGAAPRTPAALADALRDLGWTVEVGAPSKAGTQLDVVVSEL